jgi:hypothetical protein
VAKEIVLPVSTARISAISVRRRLTISAALKNSRARSAGVVCDQAGNALAAASTASFASARPPAATFAYRLRSYGL